MCDLSVLLADAPELAGSVAVVSCGCGQSRTVQPGDRAAAVVLAVPGQDRLSKVLWLLKLRYEVWQAKRTLARRGMPARSTVAVWPSLDRSMIVYDVGTTAATYAESRVLSSGQSGLGRLLRKIAGVDMGVDVVVVLGCPPGGAPLGRSAGGN